MADLARCYSPRVFPFGKPFNNWSVLVRRLIVFLTLGVFSLPAFAQRGLLISEYVEASGDNKAIEIYNGSGAAVNIGNYMLRMYFNGATAPATTVYFAGQLAPGAVYVVVHASADAVLANTAHVYDGSSWYDGDDAIVLARVSDNAIIDSIGQIGFDPGNEWGAGLVSTADNTLRRKMSVTGGDTNPFDAFNPALEWEGFTNNTFDDVGVRGAYVMKDSDGDGYADDTDACPIGDARATVILNGCDSRAPNVRFDGGCTLTDKIVALRTTAKNHGQFVSAVGKLLNGLKKDALTGAQKGAIENCAARWK
jgi:hypothetical protein